MQLDLTIKNYRCFADSRPARIEMRPGFTAFVGANNSGKSSMLKFLYEFRGLFHQLSSSPAHNNAWNDSLRSRVNLSVSVPDKDEVFCNANSRDMEIEFRFVPTSQTEQQSHPPIPERLVVVASRDDKVWHLGMYLPSGTQIDGQRDLTFANNRLFVDGNPWADLAPLRPVFQALRNTLYVGAFRNAINTGAENNYFDIQVGQAFVQAWKNWKTGQKKERREAALRLTQGIQSIFGFEQFEINPAEGDDRLQVYVNGRSHWLSEMGSGLAQFIIVLANAAVKRPSYILIDEPELNLHPSLQLDFLTTLASYASEGVLFATHSIGLARACTERIYSFRKVAEGESEVTPYEETPRLAEFLGELSFSGYRALGFEKVLLVEGSTEVKAVQQFLRMHGKEHEIVLLSLGGSDMINGSHEAELLEVKRITENVSALIDSERDGLDAPLPADRQAFFETCGRADIRCHVLQRRATENYLSDRAVKRVKGGKYGALEPYQRLKDAPHSWGKMENWRMAREMTLDELEGTDLGEFLAALCTGGGDEHD